MPLAFSLVATGAVLEVRGPPKGLRRCTLGCDVSAYTVIRGHGSFVLGGCMQRAARALLVVHALTGWYSAGICDNVMVEMSFLMCFFMIQMFLRNQCQCCMLTPRVHARRQLR